MNHVTNLRHMARLAARLGTEIPDLRPADIARTMSAQLHGAIEAGNLRRLPQCELVELRNLVFALEALADQIEAQDKPAPRRVAWWQRVWWRVSRRRVVPLDGREWWR